MSKKTTKKPAKRVRTTTKKKPAARRRTPTIKKLPAKRLKALEAALEGGDAGALFDIDAALGDCVAPQEWKHGFGALSEPRAKFLASFYLLSEVNNGGFNQFLLNTGPEVVAPALAFLDERGPKEVAALLRKAVRALPGGRLPANNREMVDILAGDDAERIDAAHEKLNNQFFEKDPGEQMIRDRLEFVREHSGEFFG